MAQQLIPQGTPKWVFSNNGTVQAVLPTGYTLAAGDIAVIGFEGYNSNSVPTAAPAGWFIAPVLTAQLYGHITAFARKLQAGDTLPSLTGPTGGNVGVCCVVLSGNVPADVTTMFDGVQARTSTSTNQIPFQGITPNAANDYILGFGFRLKTSTGNNETVTSVPPGSNLTQLIPVASQTGTGLACCLLGEQQTTATAIPIGSCVMSAVDSSLNCGGLLLAIKSAALATAAFTVPPVVNGTTALPNGAYTVGFTPNAAGTLFAVAIQAGTPAPSVAQVKAGQDSLGNAALAVATLVVAGATASTVTLGGGLTNPLYDLYFVYHTTVDSSEASLLAQFLQPDTSQQFTVVTGGPQAGTDSILTGASPAASVGDVIECDTQTTPAAFTLAMSGTGIPEYVGDTSTQSFTARVFQRSSGTWSARATFTVNSPPPVLLNTIGPLAYDLSAQITPQPLAQMWQSATGGLIAVTADPATLPPGIFVSGNAFVGAGTAQGVYQVALTGTDSNNQLTTPTVVTVIVGLVQIDPVAVGRLQADELAVLSTSFLTGVPVSVPSSNQVGTVITTAPLPGTFVKPFSNVVVSIAIPLPDDGGGSNPGGGGSTGGTGSSPGGGSSTPPPVTGPIGSTPRSPNVQLSISDLFHYLGADLSTSAQLDLMTVTGITMGAQRILRRLGTNPGDYPWDNTYGAGLPQKLGSPLDLPGLTALVTSQTLLEQSVAQAPPPVATITQAPDMVSIIVNVEYTDNPSGVRTVLNFNVSP